MGRTAKGPRLFLKRGVGRQPVWVIRHGAQMFSTGCYEHQRSVADEILAAYCEGGRYEPAHGEVGHVTRPETVYFVTCDVADFPVKIGVASCVETRVRALSVGLPYRPRILATMSGGIQQELLLHMRFAGDRLRGEWFRRSDELMELIRSVASETRQAKKLKHELEEIFP